MQLNWGVYKLILAKPYGSRKKQTYMYVHICKHICTCIQIDGKIALSDTMAKASYY